MTNYKLLPASEQNLDEIMAIEHECFGKDSWLEETMRFELAADHTRYFVVVENELVIGYAGLSKLPGSEQADIQTVAVVPSARGRGLGRVLMDRLITEAKKLGAGELFLEVRADNPVAQNLYASLGFEHIDTRKRYYQPDNVDAWIMRDRLTPMNSSEPIVLGIESSCDETGIGIVRGNTLLANVISSSMDLHARFGGVVPEIAARAHVISLDRIVERALKKAGVTLGEVDAINQHQRERTRAEDGAGHRCVRRAADALDRRDDPVDVAVASLPSLRMREDGVHRADGGGLVLGVGGVLGRHARHPRGASGSRRPVPS